MLKLTFTLAAALYAGFVIWGQPTDGMAAAEAEAATPVVMAAANYDRPVILTNASSEPAVTRNEPVVPDAAVIAASAPAPNPVFSAPRLIGEPVVVNLLQPAAVTASAETTPDAQAGMLVVSGSRVNMRSGPSTGNRVVDSLPQGTLTEPLGAPENGWQQIRDVATGQTGWMASRFLDPA
ncbi:SH3 domain-containing protein [Jannaschia sp. KMU-145]|uniref:SH3 domain-containing protein n=1 Tax=Jannaschia halovivens TaxID=3388667 RepID=UPI00396B30B7